MPAPTLVVQTTYAELLERCAGSTFSDAFPEAGTFTPKTIKGRRYWYFQTGTSDVDIVQFTNVSVAVGDRTPPPMLEVLKEIDGSFRQVPHPSRQQFATSYIAKNRLRVDFVTPHERLETDLPQKLPALNTDAQPLRFLDDLNHEPAPAVVLYGSDLRSGPGTREIRGPQVDRRHGQAPRHSQAG